VEHGLLILAGLVFWWPVFSLQPQELSTAVKLVYLGAAYVGSAFLSLALIFSASAFYGFYEEAPRLVGPLAREGPEPRRDPDERRADDRLLRARSPTSSCASSPRRKRRSGRWRAGEARRPRRARRGARRRARTAQANGDPASDVLITQQVFIPFEAPISSSAKDELIKTVAAANERGYKIRVAVIAFTGDLGTAVSLWRHPQSYSKFLGSELAFVYRTGC
jgi:hypothetical protein